MLVMPVLWFSTVMLYFGINFSYDKLSGNVYVNGIVAGSSEILAYIVIGYLADCTGRRPLTIIFYIVAGLGSVAYCFVYNY